MSKTVHLKYNNMPICLSSAGEIVRAAAGRSNRLLTEALMSEVPEAATCEFCRITMTLWAADEGLSEILQPLTAPQRTSLTRARLSVESCLPESPEYFVSEQQFRVAMHQLELSANKQIAWMRSNPILG